MLNKLNPIPEKLTHTGRVSAILLAGGTSSRMGTDKRTILLEQKTLAEIARDKLESLSSDILISAGDDLPEFRGYRRIPDREAGEGPLGGIISCIPYCRHEQMIVLSCDMPLIPPSLLEELLQQFRTPATLPVHRQQVQPLCGIYHKDLLPHLDQQYKKGVRKLRDALEDTGTIHLSTERLSLPVKDHWFLNINRPEDLREAEHYFRD